MYAPEDLCGLGIGGFGGGRRRRGIRESDGCTGERIKRRKKKSAASRCEKTRRREDEKTKGVHVSATRGISSAREPRKKTVDDFAARGLADPSRGERTEIERPGVFSGGGGDGVGGCGEWAALSLIRVINLALSAACGTRWRDRLSPLDRRADTNVSGASPFPTVSS